MNRLLRLLLHALQPVASAVDHRERTRAALGAAVGIALTALLSQASLRWMEGPLWLAAPIGASAVLVFALPASPLAQPWAVVVGNAISAIAGWACAQWIPDVAWAASAAVALAMALMFLGRCLHPPGGGVAVLGVLAQSDHLGSVLWPVILNSLSMVAAGMLYNNATGRRYPHPQQPRILPSVGTPEPAAPATQRTLGRLRCVDIMSSPAIALKRDATPLEAHALMAEKSIKALPVVDDAHRVVGIVSAVDLVRRGTAMSTVDALMTHPAKTVSMHQWVTELLPVFSEQGHHHLPVVDDRGRLVGMVTQSDLVRALHQTVP